VEPTDPYVRDWLGASGIAIKLLYDGLRRWVTPYDPANKLILSAGPLIGTTAPGACKSNMSTLGPVTGGWASSCSDSYTGGELKCAGYDAVVIEGRARTPVYLWIRDDRVEVRDAAFLWGRPPGIPWRHSANHWTTPLSIVSPSGRLENIWSGVPASSRIEGGPSAAAVSVP